MPPIRATSPSHNPTVVRATICNAARQIGVNPQDRAEVLDLPAVAITRLAWRDSPVEDWHADPDSRISDPELMRANAATTRLARGVLELHVPEPSDRSSGACQLPHHTDADRLFTSIRHALLAPDPGRPPGRMGLAPDWPPLVAEFTACLKNPDRASSPTMTTRLRTLALPAQAADSDQLRRLLLAGPDRLDTETATYCLQAGLGTLLPIR